MEISAAKRVTKGDGLGYNTDWEAKAGGTYYDWNRYFRY